jgi:diadenosine tetraphosphate (Ap4A) HIT family hydrolase
MNDGETCLACDRMGQIRDGSNPYIVAEMRESFAVLADDQKYEGYTILLLKDHVEHLHALSRERQIALFADVIDTAAAVTAAFRPVRLNYECLGNSLAHVHWHVIPRYDGDPDPAMPIWVRPSPERKTGVASDRLRELIARLKEHLEIRGQ